MVSCDIVIPVIMIDIQLHLQEQSCPPPTTMLTSDWHVYFPDNELSRHGLWSSQDPKYFA